MTKLYALQWTEGKLKGGLVCWIDGTPIIECVKKKLLHWSGNNSGAVRFVEVEVVIRTPTRTASNSARKTKGSEMAKAKAAPAPKAVVKKKVAKKTKK